MRKIVSLKANIPMNQMRLIYMGKLLEDHMFLNDTINEDDAVIHLIQRPNDAA